MSLWKVEIIGPAKAELRTLPKDMQARFLRVAGLIEEFGPHKVGMPHVRPIDGKLWEMRMTGRDGIARAIYFAARGRRIMVMRVFVKKSQKTPRREIELAAERMKEFDDG